MVSPLPNNKDRRIIDTNPNVYNFIL
jgi:hypothetical protein